MVSDKAKIALFDPLSKLGEGWRDVGVDSSSCTYDRTFGMHLLAGLAAAAENRGPIKKKDRNSAVKLKASD